MTSWTQARIEKLAELLAHPDALSAREIANQLNALPGGPLSRNAVIGRVVRSGQHLPQAVADPATKARANARRTPPPRPQRRVLPPRARARVDIVAPPPIGPIGNFPPDSPSPGLIKSCRFIAGDPRAPDFQCCGHPVFPGSPWCEAHLPKMYQAGTSWRDLDIRRRQEKLLGATSANDDEAA